MRLAYLLPVTALAACATAKPVVAEPVVAEPAETCRNQSLASFIGQPRSEALAKRMLQASGAKTVRWVAKGMMVTMDYRGDRLTVHLDAAGQIERANCG